MSDEKYKHIGEIEDRVVEELGELLQAIGKARRFGYFNHHPDRPESNNLKELQDEMLDLQGVLFEYHQKLYRVSMGKSNLKDSPNE